MRCDIARSDAHKDKIVVTRDAAYNVASRPRETFYLRGSQGYSKRSHLCFHGLYYRRSTLAAFCLRTANQRGHIDQQVAKSTGDAWKIGIENERMNIGIEMSRDGRRVEGKAISISVGMRVDW